MKKEICEANTSETAAEKLDQVKAKQKKTD